MIIMTHKLRCVGAGAETLSKSDGMAPSTHFVLGITPSTGNQIKRQITRVMDVFSRETALGREDQWEVKTV